MNPILSLDRSCRLDVIMRRGDSFSWAIECENPDGSPFDFTGFAATCEVFKGVADNSPNHTFTVALSSGQILITMTATNTQKLRRDGWIYFLKLTYPDASKYTWLNGLLNVNEGVFTPIVSTSALTINPAGTAVTLTIAGGTSGGGPVTVTWEDIEDKPTTFPPSAHTHAWNEVTGKPANLLYYYKPDGSPWANVNDILAAITSEERELGQQFYVNGGVIYWFKDNLSDVNGLVKLSETQDKTFIMEHFCADMRTVDRDDRQVYAGGPLVLLKSIVPGGTYVEINQYPLATGGLGILSMSGGPDSDPGKIAIVLTDGGGGFFDRFNDYPGAEHHDRNMGMIIKFMLEDLNSENLNYQLMIGNFMGVDDNPGSSAIGCLVYSSVLENWEVRHHTGFGVTDLDTEIAVAPNVWHTVRIDFLNSGVGVMRYFLNDQLLFTGNGVPGICAGIWIETIMSTDFREGKVHIDKIEFVEFE